MRSEKEMGEMVIMTQDGQRTFPFGGIETEVREVSPGGECDIIAYSPSAANKRLGRYDDKGAALVIMEMMADRASRGDPVFIMPSNKHNAIDRQKKSVVQSKQGMDVTGRYARMLTSFADDFDLARNPSREWLDQLQGRIAAHDQQLLRDMDLLQELEMALRYGYYKIVDYTGAKSGDADSQNTDRRDNAVCG